MVARGRFELPSTGFFPIVTVQSPSLAGHACPCLSATPPGYNRLSRSINPISLPRFPNRWTRGENLELHNLDVRDPRDRNYRMRMDQTPIDRGSDNFFANKIENVSIIQQHHRLQKVQCRVSVEVSLHREIQLAFAKDFSEEFLVATSDHHSLLCLV